jgi:PKD repeat protein
MFRFLLCIFCISLINPFTAQTLDALTYKSAFESAYTTNPILPKGILEAVAFAQTRIKHLSGNTEGCSGMPQVKGVMGLTEDGKGYFNNNLIYISELSGYTVANIKSNPSDNIAAYAKAYAILMERSAVETDEFSKHDQLLKTLSEIPWNKNAASNYALSCFTYEVFNFLNNPIYQDLFDFPAHAIDLTEIYGVDNLGILTSEQILISPDAVYDEERHEFEPRDRSAEYGPALWNAAAACNYSSRLGVSISAVTVHTIQGSYAGAISWAKNCLSSVSYHYVVRSSDGQVTQMVIEANKAWHVGSANPYTIGIEHEGYVSDPIWYTEAMYVSSANLVRDITESGYGIDPLRTYQGPATAATLTLGGCVKIKGHQHFPGAAHTDPGIHWNWEHYYQLINDDPVILTYTSPTGTFFDSGGIAGDYDDDERKLYLIQPADALTITLSVQAFGLEEDWDFLTVYDGEDLDAPIIGEYTGTTISDIITSSGGSLLIEFRSDCATTDLGWEIDWTTIEASGVGDELPPITEVVIDDTWYTEDFLVGFEDEDDSLGSGIKYSFYQVIDYDGLEWRANNDRGFLSDNYDEALHPDWNVVTGTWAIVDDNLKQSNEALSNTNIYADLNQTDYDQLLYHWAGKITGAGADKRVGMHFMCDNPTLTNRGNSYFVWFRENGDKIQIYEVVSDVFTLKQEVTYTFLPDTWYDFKTIYDKESGEIHVWVNSIHVISWTDPSPLAIGNSVSFRSGNSSYAINDFKVYHNRIDEELITVGATGDIRYQNLDIFTPSGKIKSIAVDSAYNMSTISSVFADVDWTVPLPIDYINDGLDADISTTSSNTQLAANWSVTSDPNSGIARYWYAIGTSPGAVDIVDWTDNWYADTIVHTGLSLIYGETYYFSVRAENGAGLLSEIISTNGQLLVEPTEPPLANFNAINTDLCGIDSVQLINTTVDAMTYEWFIPDGFPSFSTETSPSIHFAESGVYPVLLVATGPGGVDSIELEITVEVAEAPIAAFEASDEIVPLDEALITFVNGSLHSDGSYWSFDDGFFSTDDDPWHLFTAVGDYDVSLIALNGGCPNDTMTKLIKVIAVSDLAEELENQIFIYPNPSTDHIYLGAKLTMNQPFSYVIFDNQGRTVQVGQFPNLVQNQLISLNQIAAGIYILKLDFDGTIVVKSLVIE